MEEAKKGSQRTTKGGPQPRVQEALNFRSCNERPCLTHAFRKRQLERPIDNHAIFSTVALNSW
jgi:hypothetical protein